MKKKFQVFIIDEATLLYSDYDTLSEAIEACRSALFEALFIDEMIIENSKGEIVKRFFWQDFNEGGKLYNPKCPQCKERKSIPIRYGYPSASTLRKAEKGLIKLGGCEVGGIDDPTRHCLDCGKNWEHFLKREVNYGTDLL